MTDRAEITEQQARLGRLLTLPDFRAAINEWLDSGFAPWVGPVSVEQATDASYVNGRAAFISQLMSEIHEFYPREYAQMEKERFDGKRRAS